MRHRDLALAVHANLELVCKLSRMRLRAIEREFGISASQLMILAQIHRKPGIRVNELASSRVITPSTASNLLDKMEARARVRRKRGQHDQRVVRIYLTGEGRKVLGKLPLKALDSGVSAPKRIPAATLSVVNSHLEGFISQLKLARP
jgi:DNA-binding MarR family transcriptional regulator